MQYEKVTPPYGTRRCLTKFLWWPLEIVILHENGSVTSSTRWLQTAKWEEKWTKGHVRDFWKRMRWLN